MSLALLAVFLLHIISHYYSKNYLPNSVVYLNPPSYSHVDLYENSINKQAFPCIKCAQELCHGSLNGAQRDHLRSDGKLAHKLTYMFPTNGGLGWTSYAPYSNAIGAAQGECLVRSLPSMCSFFEFCCQS
jgi:hypothetical protein